MKQPEQLLPSPPVMLDRAILRIMRELQRVGWLTNIYGRAERRIKKENGRKTYPSVYTGDGQYLNMFPDTELGNYCWFDVPDYEVVNGQYMQHTQNTFKSPFRIVFFFDERTIFPYSISNKEKLKHDVLLVLRRMVGPTRFVVERICERAENVYKGYNGYDEIQDQFNMYPYGTFAIEGVIWFEEECVDGDGNIVPPCCCPNN